MDAGIELNFWNESIVDLDNEIKNLKNWKDNFKEEGFLDIADAGSIFSYNVDSKWVIPWLNYDKNSYSIVRDNDKFIKALSSDENLQFTRNYSQDQNWIRLIMPKNTRRVEIEDLNRNFWVISQTVSQILQFLFKEDNPLKSIFSKMLSEIAQLNENVMNLWVEFYLTSLKYYSDVRVLFMPAQPNYSENSRGRFGKNTKRKYQPKYDRMDMVSYGKGMDFIFLSEFLDNYTYLIDKYPQSNLVIIPYIRSNNYKHNYYSRVYFPGILFFDRNQWETTHNYDYSVSGYQFKIYNENNSQSDDVSIDIRKNIDSPVPATFVYNDLYGVREDDHSYRFLRPFSSIETIEEEEVQKYYGTIRFIPTIKAKYVDNHIELDEFKIDFYDAAKMIIQKNVEPLLTLSSPEKLYSVNNNYHVREINLNYQENQPDKSLIKPYDSITMNNKLYLGEVLSWSGYTTEIERWTDGELIDFANDGILIKIGNFLPKINSESIKDDFQNVSFSYNGRNYNAEIRHQSHTINSNQVEKTAYEVNLNFTNPGGLPNKGYNPEGYKQSECYYYYPKFNNTLAGGRWTLENTKESYPYKSSIVNNGLKVISDYLFNNKTSISSSVYGATESTYQEIDKHQVNNNLDIDKKITYFIGSIGIKPWDNKSQFYWSSNLLFGIFIFIPNELLTDDIRKLISNYEYLENEKGIIFFRKEINKIEDNFWISQRNQFLYKANGTGTPWRLPKIFPYEYSLSAIQVTSQKTNAQYYLPLTTELKTEYYNNKNRFLELVSYYRDKFQSRDEFIDESMSTLINTAAGTWTVFDGNTSDDSKGTPDKNVTYPIQLGSVNINSSLNENIKKYNANNTNRQICYMDFKIDGDEIQYDLVLLRDRKPATCSNWGYRNGDAEKTDLLNINNNKIKLSDTIYLREDSDDNNLAITKVIWKNGVEYEKVEVEDYNREVNILYLNKQIKGIDLYSGNNPNWNEIDLNEVRFAILRCGFARLQNNESLGNEQYKDFRFEEYYNRCKEKNIAAGAYWFTYAKNKEEAEKDAELCVKFLQGKQFEFPIYLDFESTKGFRDNWEEIENARRNSNTSLEIIETFINYLEQNGYYCGLYISLGYSETTGIKETDFYLDLQEERKIWIANWQDVNENTLNNMCSKSGSYGLWQYSDGSLKDVYNSNGNLVRHGVEKLNGFEVEDQVDRNYCCIDFPTMMKKGGYNGYGIGNKRIEEKIQWNWN